VLGVLSMSDDLKILNAVVSLLARDMIELQSCRNLTDENLNNKTVYVTNAWRSVVE
jgi:hypothetical protein